MRGGTLTAGSVGKEWITSSNVSDPRTVILWLAFEHQVGEEAQVMIIPSSGGQITQLTFDHGKNWPHDWSPDGDKIAFAGQRDGVWNIYWISLSTKEQKQLTNYSKLNAFVRYPAWSPLGDKIVYEYAEWTSNIWLVELK